MAGRKFRRQYSIGYYVVDFYCFDERLVVELDGEVHNNSFSEGYDVRRSDYFNQFGIQVLRFENKVVFEDPEMVLNKIQETFHEQST